MEMMVLMTETMILVMVEELLTIAMVSINNKVRQTCIENCYY